MRQGRRAWLIVSALVAVCAASPAFAQGRAGAPTGHQTEAVDLNEGKSPAELFKAGCAVCHQSVAPLGKGRSARELTGFLRQHYTSSSQHAAALAGFVAANGRSAPAATPARLNPNAPVARPPAPVGREEEHRKPQEAARPPEREPAAKRRPPERHAPAAKPAPATAAAPPPAPAEPPAAAPAPEPAPEAPAPAAEAPPPPASAVEEKPAAGPDIPL